MRKCVKSFHSCDQSLLQKNQIHGSIFWHRWYRKFSKRTLHLAINKNWAVASPFIHKNGPLTRSEGDKPIICARATSEPVTWHIYYKLLHLTADICLLNPAVCRSISQTRRTTWKWMQIPQTIFYHLFIADWLMHVLLHWKKQNKKKELKFVTTNTWSGRSTIQQKLSYH